MPDNKKLKGSPDNKRIDVKDPDELRHWAQSLHVPKEKVVELVKRHGTSAEKIRQHLKGRI